MRLSIDDFGFRAARVPMDRATMKLQVNLSSEIANAILQTPVDPYFWFYHACMTLSEVTYTWRI